MNNKEMAISFLRLASSGLSKSEWGFLIRSPHADRARNMNNLPPCVLSKMNGALPHKTTSL
jgi:hypothetical protein